MKCLKDQCRSPVACGGFGYCRERNMNQVEGMSPSGLKALRGNFAETVREAIAEYYPAVFFPGIEVTLATTTSDCPMIRADLGNGEVYHVTITRARR